MKKVVLMVAMGLICAADAMAQQPSAAIWFFRTKESADAIPTRKIYETTFPVRRIATLAAGEYFGLSVEPGTYTFSFTAAPARGQSVVVPIERGQHAYVRVRADSIEMVSQADGVRAMQQSRSIGGMAANDEAVILGVSLPAMATTPTVNARALPRPAAAQVEQGMSGGEVRRFEIAINPYSWVQMIGENYHGVAASIGIHFADNFAIVGDFAINRTATLLSIQDIGIDPRLELAAARFGPRFTARSGRTSIFGQVLVGGAHQRSIADVDVSGIRTRVIETEHGWAGLAGGGIDIGINEWWSVRIIQAEYSPFYFDGGFGHGPRITGGFVFHLH